MKSTVADATTQAQDAGEDDPVIEVEDDSEST